MNIIKIFIGVLLFLFAFYMYLCGTETRGMKSKLTKQEKRYFKIIEMWFYISIYAITAFILRPIFV